MPKEDAMKRQAQICRMLQGYFTGYMEKARRFGIFGYYPLGSEVSLLPLYEWLLTRQIPLAFPRVSGNAMEFYRVVSMGDFEEGAFHVMEPLLHCQRAAWDRAYTLTPGSVFDRAGNRIGYGKGYYDRYFSAHPMLLRVGIAYERQIEEKIPAERMDVRMHTLVTEAGVCKFGDRQTMQEGNRNGIIGDM